MGSQQNVGNALTQSKTFGLGFVLTQKAKAQQQNSLHLNSPTICNGLVHKELHIFRTAGQPHVSSSSNEFGLENTSKPNTNYKKGTFK
jgi:hypothetical protein